jgi:hypothetical protein
MTLYAQKCNYYIKCNEIKEIFGEIVMYNHDADSETSLDRLILIILLKESNRGLG